MHGDYIATMKRGVYFLLKENSDDKSNNIKISKNVCLQVCPEQQ
jgi:hypothetical protein